MNTGVMFLSKTDLWETPQDFFDELDREFHFNLDVCALPENAKCKKYYTPEMDGLSQSWRGVCWCNPPYGRKIGSWVRRALFSSAAGNTVESGSYIPTKRIAIAGDNQIYVLSGTYSSPSSGASTTFWGQGRFQFDLNRIVLPDIEYGYLKTRR